MKTFSLISSFILSLTALTPQTMTAAEESPLSRDINNFAFSMYGTLSADPSQNALFSPYSVFSCLSLVYLGAKEDTATQMASALQLSVSSDELPGASAKLSDFLTPKGENPPYSLNIANALWVDQDSQLLSDYQSVAQNSYGAKVASVNFGDVPGTVSLINGWTSDQTQGKIPNLLTNDDISASTKLVVTNALYFKGSWKKAFDPAQTQPAPFYVNSDTYVSTPMMEQISSFPYYGDEQVQVVALPYTSSENEETDMACVFVLPREGQTLSSVEDTLTDATFRTWMSGLERRRVHVKIPSFTLKLRASLGDILQQMGMKVPFDPTKANFTGIIDGVSDLFVSDVIHEAFFSLDEEGVTAAAATAAIMCRCSASPTSPQLHFTFTADHPFLFAIVELKTNTILFLGKYTAPN